MTHKCITLNLSELNAQPPHVGSSVPSSACASACASQTAFLLVLCVFLLSLSVRYLKLIFPLVLLLEVLSSCGQLLENEIWQGFRLEAAQDVASSQSRSNYRTPVQESVFRSVMETVPETESRQWSHWQSSNHGAIAASEHHPLKARVCQRVS